MHLPHCLERTVVIHATRDTVFRYFTDSSRWSAWWGAGSTVDAQPGGKVYIRHPNGVETLGEVLEVCPPERMVFTYGYASGKPIAPGASRVTIVLEDHPAGTRLRLTHEVANEVYAGGEGVIDAWFGVWAEPDAGKRAAILAGTVAPGIEFRDRFSLLEGPADLTAHIAAALRFVPGTRLQRRGDLRHGQATVLAEWIAVNQEGQTRGSGSSVFSLEPGGRIRAVTSFWNPQSA